MRADRRNVIVMIIFVSLCKLIWQNLNISRLVYEGKYWMEEESVEYFKWKCFWFLNKLSQSWEPKWWIPQTVIIINDENSECNLPVNVDRGLLSWLYVCHLCKFSLKLPMKSPFEMDVKQSPSTGFSEWTGGSSCVMSDQPVMKLESNILYVEKGHRTQQRMLPNVYYKNVEITEKGEKCWL